MNALPLFISLTVLLSACGRSEPAVTDHPGGLPRDWYAPETVLTPASVTVPLETERAVDRVLDLNSRALESIESFPSPTSPPSTITGEPKQSLFTLKDWTPWHLEGFIASFAVSANGTFGFLSLDGAAAIPAVKVTWRPRPQFESHSVARPLHDTATEVKVSSGESDQALAHQLEPVIRAASASGQVGNEKVLRQELLRYGRGFREICRNLAISRSHDGWQVMGYRLELGFDFSGKVTPVLTLGGTVGVRLDWVRDEKGEREFQAPLAGRASESFPGIRPSALGKFATVVSEEVTKAATESVADPESPHGRLKKLGFKLDEVRIGLGLSASGTIGIAQAQANSMGSVILGKREELHEQAFREPASRGERTVNSPFGRERFRKGLLHALKVGAFFAHRATHTETQRWMVSEVETAFDLSVGGQLGLAQVNGLGIVALTFANEKFEEGGK